MLPELLTALTPLFVDGTLLGSGFLGGIVGNVAASFLWESGKWVGKPLLDKWPDIAELFAQVDNQNNHDLLRALRRAECRAVVALCDQALLDDFKLRTGKGPLLERLRSRLRERQEPEIRALCYIRRLFATAYDDLQSLSIEELARMHGAALSDVNKLVRAGSECFAAPDVEQLRKKVVAQQIEAFERVVRELPKLEGEEAFALRTLAFDGLPSSLKKQMEQHPQGWWDVLRLAFREELKDNVRARSAWEMDVLSQLPQQLGIGRTYEEFEAKLAGLDEKLTGVWDDLNHFRQDFDDAIPKVLALLEDVHQTAHIIDVKIDKVDSKVDTIQERITTFEELVRQRAQRPPWQLPPRAFANDFFGRVDLLATLVERLKRRDNVDISGPAGMGKTALAAEAIRAVVGENGDNRADSPYPDGVVLLDLYGLKFTSPEPAWSHLADSFDMSQPTTQSPRERAIAACRGRRALVVVEGAEEAKDGATLQELLSVLAPETTRLILTRDKGQVSTAHPIEVETPLEPEEALALLQALCGEKVDAVSLRRVQDLLGGHPLALTWAGSQLAAGGESPRAFVTALAAASLPDLHQPGDEHRTLRWLYNRSVSRLTQEAQRVLAAAGLLAQQPFPLSAAATVLENEERTARLALKSLVQHSLLRLSNRTDEEWEFTHALAHRFAHATGDTTLLNALGVWTVTYFESAAEKARRTGDLSLLGRALNHATALLRADHETNIFTAVQNFLLYDGLKQIWMLGRVDFARITIEAVHAWLECARTRQPHDAALQREQSVSYNNLGRVAVAAGQLEAARRAYEQSLAIRERLATADPSNSQWQRDLSVSYNNLGRVAVAAGQLEAARRAYEQSLAIAERLATTDPSNSEWQRDLSVSYMSIGSLLTRQHQPSDALAFLEKAQAISARLTQHDPVNAVWRNDLAWILNRIAAVQSDHFRPSWRQRTRTWVQRRLAALRERGAKETK